MSWERASLGELCLRVAKVDPVATGRDQVRYIDIGGVDGSLHRLNEVAEINSAGAPSRCRQVVAAGDTVFSTVRPYLEKVAYVDESLHGEFASTGFSVLRPGPRVEPKFLYFFAISQAMFDQVLPYQKGVSYPAVLDREVRSVSMPVPPLDEQRRIVAILEDHLSHLDAGDAYLGTAMRRLAALERAALDEFFGVRGETVPLGELVADIGAGKSFGSSDAPAALDQWGIIKVSAMTWGRFRAEENKAVAADRVDPRYEIRSGDLLVSRANTAEYVGASVLVEEVRPRLLLSDKSLRLTPRAGTDPRWLWRSLQAPAARRQITELATGTKDSMRNISQASLRRVRLPRCDGDAQLRAVEAFGRVEESVVAARSQIGQQQRRSSALRRSLLAAAFSGRLTATSEDLSVAEGRMSA